MAFCAPIQAERGPARRTLAKCGTSRRKSFPLHWPGPSSLCAVCPGAPLADIALLARRRVQRARRFFQGPPLLHADFSNTQARCWNRAGSGRGPRRQCWVSRGVVSMGVAGAPSRHTCQAHCARVESSGDMSLAARARIARLPVNGIMSPLGAHSAARSLLRQGSTSRNARHAKSVSRVHDPCIG